MSKKKWPARALRAFRKANAKADLRSLETVDMKRLGLGSRRRPYRRPAREGTTESAFLERQKRDRPDSQWWKQNGRGHAARPDRMGLLAQRLQCFIEFKRVGEFPTVAQQRELDGLEALNHFVAACDSVEQACRFVSDVECGVNRPWRRRWEDDHDV